MKDWLANLRPKRDSDHLTLTCGFFLFNPDGRVLICKAYGSTDQWTIPKGRPDPNESSLETAVRETFEETNIDLHKWSGKIYYIGSETYRNGRKRLHAYACMMDKPIRLKDLKCKSLIEGTENPEIEAYQFEFPQRAVEMLHPSQATLLDLIHEAEPGSFPVVHLT